MRGGWKEEGNRKARGQRKHENVRGASIVGLALA